MCLVSQTLYLVPWFLRLLPKRYPMIGWLWCQWSLYSWVSQDSNSWKEILEGYHPRALHSQQNETHLSLAVKDAFLLVLELRP